MQKLKQRQLQQQQLALSAQLIQESQHVRRLLISHDNIQILLKYSSQQLKSLNLSKQIDNINDYSPSSISRLIFQKQLHKIKQDFDQLPSKSCNIDHFVIIMLKVIAQKLEFQKIPLYLLGFRSIFNQIANQNQHTIRFQQLQTYVMGQVVNLNNDQTNVDTQFQIQFCQNKMQDFLIHDNGVKKIHYSHDLKKYIVLDNNSSVIKIYNQSMKLVCKFEPDKQKHLKKHPIILTFDYNELGSKLCISLSDKSLSIINISTFIQPLMTQQVFRLNPLNQVVYKSEYCINKIGFLSMMNKWVTVDQNNQIRVWDVEKIKQTHQIINYLVKHPNDDYQVTQIIQIVHLAAVLIVVNSQVHFFNQTLTKKKFKKFMHPQLIQILKYSQQKNQFYLKGNNEKFITIFSVNKSTGQPKILSTFETGSLILNFQVFAYFNSILILDIKSNLKIYSQLDRSLQHEVNYNSISKKKNLPIWLVKCTKTQFIIHSTYILTMQLKKVAIQRDIDFNFIENGFYYDYLKEEIHFSVNNMIIAVNIMHGEVRKSIDSLNSNLNKHKAVFIGKYTQPFVVDSNDNLYQILMKNDPLYKQNKDYKKTTGIINIKQSFYDQQSQIVLLLNNSSIYTVRNDSSNNFTVKSTLLMQNTPSIIKQKYFGKRKQLIFLDSLNKIIIMQSNTYQVLGIFNFQIFKGQKDQVDSSEKRRIIDFQYDQQKTILILLTNKAEIFFYHFNYNNLLTTQNSLLICQHSYIQLKDILPHKLQQLAFTTINYQKSQKKTSKRQSQSGRLFLFDQSGFIIQIQLTQILNKLILLDHQQLQPKLYYYIKDTQQFDWQSVSVQKRHTISLLKRNLLKISHKNYCFTKAHQKSIVFARRVFIQAYNLVTISEDGHIKMWTQSRQQRKLHFDLKLPLMLKLQWNMNDLHEKRNRKIINETIQFLNKALSIIKDFHVDEIHHLNTTKKKYLKNRSDKIKFNLDNPINLQFQNKQLQQYVIQNNSLSIDKSTLQTIDMTKNRFRIANRNIDNFSVTHRIGQPWRKKKQFVSLYQKASPIDKYLHKYRQKMPFDLLMLRNDLHITEPIKRVSNSSKAIKQQKLTILPQLTKLKVQSQKTLKINDQDETQRNLNADQKVQNKFQSCLFVKTEKARKKINAFDEIDRYFFKKQQQMLNKKWIPNKRNLLNNDSSTKKLDMTLQLNPVHTTPLKPSSQRKEYQRSKTIDIQKKDPVKSVIKIFQQHNKQVLNSMKGRMINIPRIDGIEQKRKIKTKKKL